MNWILGLGPRNYINIRFRVCARTVRNVYVAGRQQKCSGQPRTLSMAI